MKKLENDSIALMLTSPPYPMIEMWDEAFSARNPDIGLALEKRNAKEAFLLMHDELNKTWKEVYRVLMPGGIACVNIGDATRNVDNTFCLYPSHALIVNSFFKLGFQSLPEILWRKQTNAPNKFMGSGMMPPGAYVTLEHEFILLFRKGAKREFNGSDMKKKRRESAYFWEERNRWFSDVWTKLQGTNQKLDDGSIEDVGKTRERSAAYPFELAYRLINMFSIKGDLVLDPFLGTGTTTLAAMISERNSVGYEIDPNFKEVIERRINGIVAFGNDYIDQRIESHVNFIKERVARKGPSKYYNKCHDFAVITRQEKLLQLCKLSSIQKQNENKYIVMY